MKSLNEFHEKIRSRPALLNGVLALVTPVFYRKLPWQEMLPLLAFIGFFLIGLPALMRRRKAYAVHAFFVLAYFGINKVTARVFGVYSYSVAEFALSGALYLALYAVLKESRTRFLSAMIPLALFYLIHDIYYRVLGGVIRVTDVVYVGDLLGVATAGELLLYGGLLLGGMAWLAAQVDFRRRALPVAAAALMLGATAFWFRPGWFSAPRDPDVEWDDYVEVLERGRLTALLSKAAGQLRAIRRIPEATEEEAAALMPPAEVMKRIRPRNLHLVVLESFFLPTLFSDPLFEDVPVPEGFRKYLPAVNLVRSPVFGGKTAQAEFEVLCGVPAYERFGFVEFSMMTGKPTVCLPAILARAGFRAVATYPYSLSVFNASAAYRSLGFESVYSLPRYGTAGKTYLEETDSPGGFFSDSALLDQNRGWVLEQDGPVLNYVLGIYGHRPFERDLEKRPDVWRKEELPGDLNVVVNQFYYRARALARYLDDLTERDPESVILVMGDHLPPVGRDVFRRYGYAAEAGGDALHRVPALVVTGGRPVRFAGLGQYDLPAVILDYLSDGAYCRARPCAHLGQSREESRLIRDYERILSLSIR